MSNISSLSYRHSQQLLCMSPPCVYSGVRTLSYIFVYIHIVVYFGAEFSSRVQYKEELSATEAGVMVGYIRLLDVLSSQEFVFPSDDGLGPSTISPSLPGDVDVSGVVSMGLLVLTRVISPELLQHYPAVQGSYFNVLSYALSSSEHILPVGGRNKRSGGSETLRDFLGITEDVMADIVGKILNLLLWGVTSSLNTSTARMALQGIQNCAVAQLTSGD